MSVSSRHKWYPSHSSGAPLQASAGNALSGTLVPLLFPGVKGEAISRSALGARAGLSAAIPKVEGGCAVEAAVQQADVEEVAVLGGNGARGEEEGRGTSSQVGRKHQELRCKSISTHLLSQDFGAVRLEHHGLGSRQTGSAGK